MDDLISRQALCEYALNQKDKSVTPNDIMRFPPAQPERTGEWIPCSDAPDTNRNVFIARGEQSNMTACIGHYDHDYKQWYEDRNWFATCLYDGLYWCEIPPLPEPYCPNCGLRME